MHDVATSSWIGRLIWHSIGPLKLSGHFVQDKSSVEQRDQSARRLSFLWSCNNHYLFLKRATFLVEILILSNIITGEWIRNAYNENRTTTLYCILNRLEYNKNVKILQNPYWKKDYSRKKNQPWLYKLVHLNSYISNCYLCFLVFCLQFLHESIGSSDTQSVHWNLVAICSRQKFTRTEGRECWVHTAVSPFFRHVIITYF